MPASRSIGSENQLLFDDTLVEDKRGFVLTLNAPVKAETAALLPEKPWEKGVHGPSVMEEEDGTLRMYYGVTGDNAVRSLCYATSSDGIVWQRPSLGLVEYNGSADNNLVLTGVDGTVFHDPNAPAAERYKLIGGDKTLWGVTSVNCGGARFRYFKEELETWQYSGVIGAYSADGIHWTKYPEPIMPWYTDTLNVAFWDERIGRYVAYVRLNEHLRVDETGKQVGSFDYRTIARAETDDFAHFPQPVKVAEPDFTLAQDEDQVGGGLYNSAAIKYGGAADSYFIFPAAYYHTSDTLDIQLATSRDGIHFDRWSEPFVRLGAAGRFDSKGIYMGTGVVYAGDEIYLYYNGVDARHDIDVDVIRVAHQQSGIGRLRLRRDGFVSQDAGSDESWLTTVPFVVEGDRLKVNMDASSRGWLKVEVLDETGHALWGFEKSVADRLMFNELAQTVTWEGRSQVSSLRGRSVRLRFIGQSVKLYSFQFESD
jgi:hypothetical protein